MRRKLSFAIVVMAVGCAGSSALRDAGDTGEADATNDGWTPMDVTPGTDSRRTESGELGGEVGLDCDSGGASDSADSPLGDAGVVDAGGSPDVLLCAPAWCRDGECVPIPPGCGKLSCGSPPGRTYCGLIGDGCGGVLDCSPTCPQPDSICTADHQCKTPLGLCSDLACEMNGVQYCGPISDACGTIVCSTTCKQPGWECVDGRCVDPACVPPACEWPPPPVLPPFTGEWPPAPPLPAPCVAPISP